MIAASKRLLTVLTALLFALAMGAGSTALTVNAASGTVYTCTINRCYAHPVTGEIEDSGGKAAYTTGQGMVEGCVHPTGMLEVTDDGNYYLTIQMSLSDYTSGNSFLVQSVGDSGWSTPAMGVTGNGTDTNGTTTDYCIQVPSQDCVVRGTMYVKPMGRNVIFYLFPSDFKPGNSSGMNATMVTEASQGDASPQTPGTNEAANTGGGANGTDNAPPNTTSGTGSTPGAATGSPAQAAAKGAPGPGGIADSTITKAASPEAKAGADDSELNSAQGLSLSTAAVAPDKKTDKKGQTAGIAKQASAITIAGLILIAVGAAVVYYFRKNWYRWGGGDDDD